MKPIKDNPMLSYYAIRPFLRGDGTDVLLIKSRSKTEKIAREILKISTTIITIITISEAVLEEYAYIINGNFSKGDKSV